MATRWASLGFMGPEVFGVPVIIILAAIIALLASLAEERKKRLKPWHKISIGMTPESIQTMLGHPGQISHTGNQETWTYGIGLAQGSVTFEDGKVVGYRKPPGS